MLLRPESFLALALEFTYALALPEVTNDYSGTNGISTSIVTVATIGHTATGTFELDSLTAYKGLRQSITTTAVATNTNGQASQATEAVVVLAGGVAWFLADSSGDAVASIPSPQTPQDHQDDKDCPNPKSQCKNCGGHGQMCTTGKYSGCACKRDRQVLVKKTKCPADGSDNQPGCEDEDCAAQNGKCTAGTDKGCDCAAAVCPDVAHFWCDDCGGDDGTGKCKGDSCQDYALKTCPCRPDPDWNKVIFPVTRQNVVVPLTALAKQSHSVKY